MSESNALTLFVTAVGTMGTRHAGAAGSVGLLRSRIGSVPRSSSRACSVAWMPWLAPNDAGEVRHARPLERHRGACANDRVAILGADQQPADRVL